MRFVSAVTRFKRISSSARKMCFDMWDYYYDPYYKYNTYSVGPSCYTMFSVKATDDRCGMAMVTINKKDLLLSMIPQEKLQKFIDQLDTSGLAAWEDYLADLEDIEMSNEFLEEYGCWTEGECLCAILASAMGVLNVNEIEKAEILGQELNLGEFLIEVTVYDYSGNSDTTTIAITIVDFQMPICEGWNLRSTWLDLENNKWQDIVALDGGLDADTILRWNIAEQRWEQYRVLDDVHGWYDGDTFVATALMEPLEAYWIHGLYNDQFGLITSRGAQTAPPSRQLYAGWNLIGADINWESKNMDVDDALKSIEEATGHCTGYTQVLSIDQWNEWSEEFYICGTPPSYDTYEKWFWQDTWVYVVGKYSAPDMTRGGGYWVFMENPAVLAGWNSTPLPMGFWEYWWTCGP